MILRLFMMLYCSDSFFDIYVKTSFLQASIEPNAQLSAHILPIYAVLHAIYMDLTLRSTDTRVLGDLANVLYCISVWVGIYSLSLSLSLFLSLSFSLSLSLALSLFPISLFLYFSLSLYFLSLSFSTSLSLYLSLSLSLKIWRHLTLLMSFFRTIGQHQHSHYYFRNFPELNKIEIDTETNSEFWFFDRFLILSVLWAVVDGLYLFLGFLRH